MIDDKIINFLLVLVTGKIWGTYDRCDFKNIDLWDNDPAIAAIAFLVQDIDESWLITRSSIKKSVS